MFKPKCHQLGYFVPLCSVVSSWLHLFPRKSLNRLLQFPSFWWFRKALMSRGWCYKQLCCLCLFSGPSTRKKATWKSTRWLRLEDEQFWHRWRVNESSKKVPFLRLWKANMLQGVLEMHHKKARKEVFQLLFHNMFFALISACFERIHFAANGCKTEFSWILFKRHTCNWKCSWIIRSLVWRPRILLGQSSRREWYLTSWAESNGTALFELWL